ncbi:Gfo/Idh/MocA family protein [Paenactinomyces guangxiensis]|uniref:Gfo/Idh/MocA family oxidoreductase n=1 Tax=Paenactinomyces guangxiensis TaxID=1490290 RepID=A0A7W1WMY1_9BACL|nr:Gfo/Idh/MocA family oxidoreductase [Paenactinomyces guangxiensis]MBA4492849.1 Gfo/Idh/MocA family oxidoreductase [Paenactinomyces guangxiensis]MBH8590302.1 Gfo/Idh/MocA family oxidoreductase [Paenactinomyces guangxiensis]
MKKVRVGIIGCGSIAKYRHIAEYADHPDVELAAFCDIVTGRAESFAAQYGGKAYRDYVEMIEQESLDAVSICTPNVIHAPAAIAAAHAKCHVLCEKPMATSLEEAEKMIRAANENGVLLMIGHNQRLMPPHVKAKEILKEGSLGKVLTFRTSFSHGGPEGWSADGSDSWFFRKQEAFVGAMGDLGVHKIDLLSWLLEEEIVEISAMLATLQKTGDVDDNAVMVARTESGAIGTITASWTHSPGEDNSTILYCEKGILKVGTDPVDQVIVERTDGSIEKFQVGKMASNEEGGQVKSGVIDSFVRAILTNSPALIPGEDAIKALRVVMAAIKSSEEKRSVNIHELN